MRGEEESLLYFLVLGRVRGYWKTIFGDGSVGINMDGIVRIKLKAVIN